MTTRFHAAVLTLVLSGCATTITGRVVSTDPKIGLTAGKINVLRLDAPGGAKSAVVADVLSDGSFATPGDLPEGQYLVEPLIPGFTSESKTVSTRDSKDLILKANPLASPQRAAIGAGTAGNQARGEGSAVLTPPEM